jgi:hypothetical protein
VKRGVVIAVIATWLILSFVPALSLTSLTGMGRGGRGK